MNAASSPTPYNSADFLNSLRELSHERVCPGKVFLQVWGQDDLLALGSLHTPEQNHPLPGKCVQVDIIPMIA